MSKNLKWVSKYRISQILTCFSLVFVAVFSCVVCGYTHGDLHERIQKVTKEIKVNPDSSYLYLKRGVLYYQHEEYNKSLTDLNHASALNYKDEQLDINFAKVHLKLQNFPEAKVHLNNILDEDNQHVNAWKLMGEVHYALEEYDQAALAFMFVIEYADESFPSNYLDAAMCFDLQNTEASYSSAVEVIQQGIDALGPIVNFYEKLVQLHIKNKKFNQAILAQTEIVTLSNRKEKSLYERAEIYLLMNENSNALADFEAAKEAIMALPLRIQRHLAIKNLLADIESNISDLKI